MPVELQVIQASEFVQLDADEHLDFAATRQALQSLARACWKRGVNSAMIDLRSLPVLEKPHFTTAELAALVGTFRDAGFAKQQRLAVLYRHDLHGGIRNFAFIGRMRGMNVQAFSDYEKAIAWLSAGNCDQSKPTEEGAAIAIKKPGQKSRKTPVSVIRRSAQTRARRKT